MDKAKSEKLEKHVLKDLTTAGVETRCRIREDAVKEYAQRIREGEAMDPIVVFRDDANTLWVAAGHHRLAAHDLAREPRIACLVYRGTRWDAIEFGIHDNQQHRGERLSRADKQFNVKRVLDEQPGMSDRAIGELCGVSHATVGRFRPRGTIDQVTQRVGRDGKTYDVPADGGKPAAYATPVPGADSDRCKCGSEWEADGNGGRSCPACGADHPIMPSRIAHDEAVAMEQPPEHTVVDRVEDAPGADGSTGIVPAKVATMVEDLAAVEADTQPSQPGGTWDGLPPEPEAAVDGNSDAASIHTAFEDERYSLGRFKTSLSQLADEYPGPFEEEARLLLDQVGDVLNRWEEAEIQAK